jgi:hypothetical protein
MEARGGRGATPGDERGPVGKGLARLPHLAAVHQLQPHLGGRLAAAAQQREGPAPPAGGAAAAAAAAHVVQSVWPAGKVV